MNMKGYNASAYARQDKVSSAGRNSQANMQMLNIPLLRQLSLLAAQRRQVALRKDTLY